LRLAYSAMTTIRRRWPRWPWPVQDPRSDPEGAIPALSGVL
jgi:hypothetical protein